jgi:ribosomal protein L11 methyltransferase
MGAMITSPSTPGHRGDEPTTLARLTTDEATARRILDALSEAFDTTDAAISTEEEAAGSWIVAIHFRDPPSQTALRALVALAAGAEAGNAIVFDQVAAKDWVKASLEGLRPVAAGRFLVHGAHDRHRVPSNKIGIEIEAALAFGTGHHGTTRGCLLALDRILRIRRPHRILDIGTGSGVLAIAAARVAHHPVLASDIDASAVRVARANARLNQAAATVSFVHAGGLAARNFRERAPFDLIFANILLGPIKRLAVPLTAHLAPGGYAILSGLLLAQAPAALTAYRAQGLRLVYRIELDGWSTLVLRRATVP